MSERKFRFFRFIALILSLSFLIAVDLSIRFCFPSLQEEMNHLRVLAKDETSRQHSVIKEPDPDLLWRLKPGCQLLPHEHLNSLGFRGPEFRMEKNPGDIRIICIGDSRTFGFGIDSWQYLYPYLLQNLLKQAYPQYTIEVFDMAVLGYTSFQGLQLLKKHVLSFHPDIVIVWFGFNDTLFFHKTDLESATTSRYISSIRNFLDRSSIYTLLRKSFRKIRSSATTPIQVGQRIVRRVPLESYQSNLKEIIHICQRNHIKPLLLTSPLRPDIPLILNSKLIRYKGTDGRWYERLQFQYHLDGFWLMTAQQFPGTESQLDNLMAKYPELPILHYFKAQFLRRSGAFFEAETEKNRAIELDTERRVIAEYNESTIRLAQSKHVLYLDLAPIFKKLDQYPDTYFVDECHPNRRGHEIICNALFPILRSVIDTIKP